MLKGRRRSGHGAFTSAQQPAISNPTNFVSLSGRSENANPSLGTGESPSAGPANDNSVMPDPNVVNRQAGEINHGAVGEPLVLDYQQMHDEQHAAAPPAQDAPLTPIKSSNYNPLGSHPVDSEANDNFDGAPPPPDFTRRGIHIPMRTSSAKPVRRRRFIIPSSSMPSYSAPGSPDSHSRARSSADSEVSYATSASSIATQNLAPLQQKGPPDDVDRLSPLLEDDPRSFDLLAPDESNGDNKSFSLELRSEQLFSKKHLEAIFADTSSLLRFTSFLSTMRPNSVPVLIYYLDALKALRAINYANAVAEALEPLEGLDFTENPARPTVNAILEDRANKAFEILVRDELPAFITHTFVQIVSLSIQKRVIGNLPPMLREASEGLAEVFCLTDPSKTDNPIVFASEEFHRTTQYGVSYAIGRNCRFLQGPRTNRNTVGRLSRAVKEGQEVSEVFLNYRRDGSPFMNLLLMAPLFDSRGTLRYFIGAQVDVSGLCKDATDLDAFQRMLDKQEGNGPAEESKDEFQELSEMFNNAELETVRKFGGNMHKEHLEDDRDDASIAHRPRLLIKDMTTTDYETEGDKTPKTPLKAEGRLGGVYKHYLLIRPAPSLRILFTSPSLRVPGILQSRFLDRIGGSERVRDSLAEALADGSRGVTAKIRWLSTAAANLDAERAEEGRPRWIHCTPLLGHVGTVGVWMVVLVEDDKGSGAQRRFRTAPPVPNDVRTLKQTHSPLASPHQAPKNGPAFNPSTPVDEFDITSGHTPLSNGRHPHFAAMDALRRPGSGISEQRTTGSSSPSYLNKSGAAPRRSSIVELVNQEQESDTSANTNEGTRNSAIKKREMVEQRYAPENAAKRGVDEAEHTKAHSTPKERVWFRNRLRRKGLGNFD